MTDSDLSSEQIAEALKFIVHFVGDITQPLHDEAYETGGNEVDVTYQGSCTTEPRTAERGEPGGILTK